jgi:hypothetical protein
VEGVVGDHDSYSDRPNGSSKFNVQSSREAARALLVSLMELARFENSQKVKVSGARQNQSRQVILATTK